uniref:Transposase MuDR plant domain-containing protein n=1 Tax=Triticum urartu TaxID=4572 RepID=A0A8R7JZX2_TRIUA
MVHDIENPDIRVGALFPDIVTFRKAIRQRAILVGFKLAKIKTDKTRFIVECAHGPCPWRIHASTLQDGRTVMVWVVYHAIIYLM